MKGKILGAVVAALVGSSANAAIVTYNYTNGLHTEGWYLRGSNGPAVSNVYGDGAYWGVSAQNKCVDNPNVGGQTCASLGKVNGDNGTYQTTVPGAPNPVASFAGSLTYDTSQTFTYTDKISNVTETWYVVTGGTLAWTGTYGLEVVVGPSNNGSSTPPYKVGGSFFQYSFANGNVNLLTGVRTSTSKCDLGIAGQAVVGAILCGAANPASGFAYGSAGSYVKPTNWTGVRELGDGTIELLMYGTRYTSTNGGNDLQERLRLGTQETPAVPVPGAVWLFGSAMGLLAGLRRRARAA